MKITNIVFNQLRKFSNWIVDIDKLEGYALVLEETSITDFVILIEYLDNLCSILQFCSFYGQQAPIDIRLEDVHDGVVDYYEDDEYDEVDAFDDIDEDEEDYEDDEEYEDYEEIDTGYEYEENIDTDDVDEEDYEDDEEYEENIDTDDVDEEDYEDDEEYEDYEEIDQYDDELTVDNDFDIEDDDEEEEYEEVDNEDIFVNSSHKPTDMGSSQHGDSFNDTTIDLSDDFPDFNLTNGKQAINKAVLNDKLSDATMETIINIGTHIKTLSDMLLNKDKRKKNKKG